MTMMTMSGLMTMARHQVPNRTLLLLEAHPPHVDKILRDPAANLALLDWLSQDRVEREQTNR